MGGSACQLCNSGGSHGSGRTALCLAPPWALAKEALFAMTIPIAEAVKRAITQSWSEHPFSTCMVISAAGRMPQLPAVGAATIRPMEAFNSETASARYRAPERKGPVRLCPFHCSGAAYRHRLL